MQRKKCSFIGHRNTTVTPELKGKLKGIVERLINQNGVSIFLFGSKSRFDDLCFEIVSELKELYPDIRRVYVRSVYPELSKFYEKYILEDYEETYMPERIENAGRASYVERNQTMIDESDFCIVYYNENYKPPRRKNARRAVTDYQPKSGTALAYEYAKQRKRGGKDITIINIFEEQENEAN